MDDGRDMFEDDEAEVESHSRADRKHETKTKGSKKRLRDVNNPAQANGSIRTLFGNVATQKKEPQVTLAEDDILAELLGEINPNAGASNCEAIASSSGAAKSSSLVSDIKIKEKSELATVKEYMQNFTKTIQKKPEPKGESTSDDVLSLFSEHFESNANVFLNYFFNIFRKSLNVSQSHGYRSLVSRK